MLSSIPPPSPLPTLALVLFLESLLSYVILTKVPYTEIDWVAYMSEVSGYVHGERNYYNLSGATGPLVYPAGFLYVYEWMRWYAGGDGRDVRKAQWVFVGVYITNRVIVAGIYKKAMVDGRKGRDLAVGKWKYLISLVLLTLSKRVHSLYSLRLFNDCITVLLMNLAILIFISPSVPFRNHVASLVYSLSVSVKMNSLLYAPAVLLLYLQSSSVASTIASLSICAGVQLALGYPFLSTFPVPYLRKAFELDRVFFYKWTVNLKFLPEAVFLSKPLSLLLLAAHVASIIYLISSFLTLAKSQSKPLRNLLVRPLSPPPPSSTPNPQYVCYLLWSTHFLGIAFARTLHYQFYAWYFDSLPLLTMVAIGQPFVSFLSRSSFPSPHPIVSYGATSLLVMGMVEYAFNVYPASKTSSGILQAAHGGLVVAVLIGGGKGINVFDTKKKGKHKKTK
ncbi:hypothetical protein TrCOL_g9337 [Triparma columacea]|uniref:dolichyl-P-Man:Man5GlcNAc2-PP-dolichol alpha-1,3-mannosyltransferase n=1 Tax=Triparma columacea TaxID=722753 RepID=A0A9W7GJJ3_9STRA|nr:hypothetical protein TrCOL_g9337 [Triparma columacea]